VQAVLAPAQPLEVGARYALDLEHPPELPPRHRSPDEKPELAPDWLALQPQARTWDVAAPSSSRPSWSGSPSLLGDNHCPLYRRLLRSCDGGAPELALAAPAERASYIRVRVDGALRIEYLLPLSTDGVHVGGLNGAALLDGSTYQVTLTAVDEAGHEAAAPGEPLEVEGFRT
jgi:hypothetical protein